MAEGENITPDQTSGVVNDSDVLYDFYCQFCSDDGTYREAAGFCVDCQEYLCDSCLSAHRRTRQSRYHHIQDKDEMPKDTPLPREPERRDISTKCKVHPETTVEFYCNAHNTFGCNTYCFKSHQNCPGMKSIIEESKGIFENLEYTKMIQILKTLDHRSRDISSKANSNIKQIRSSHLEVLKAIDALRAQVNAHFDKLEKEVKAGADKTAMEEEKQMEQISRNCNSIALTVEKIQAEIADLQSSKLVCQAYIVIKESNEEIEKLKTDLHLAEEAFVLKNIHFMPNAKLQCVLNEIHELGEIVIEDTLGAFTEATQSTKMATTQAALTPSGQITLPVTTQKTSTRTKQTTQMAITQSAQTQSTEITQTGTTQRSSAEIGHRPVTQTKERPETWSYGRRHHQHTESQRRLSRQQSNDFLTLEEFLKQCESDG